ncbi:MAG: Na(+)-translocating NADH-quinone reductase subunit A [Planctomycetota bacterium]
MSRRFDIRKGLDLPIAGEPVGPAVAGPEIHTVGIVADDYVGMKPTMAVTEGDRVKLGQLLFTDKKTEGVRYTSPGCGRVVSVNRGAKRAFQSVVIALEGDEREQFAAYPDDNLSQLSAAAVEDNLLASGLWTALLTRPYSKVPTPGTRPDALFITAVDTNPLAADPAPIIGASSREFVAGVQALSTLANGPAYLCKAADTPLPGDELACVEVAEFSGPHPAGLPGTHIHLLAPASMQRTVWHVGYQDVIAVGHLMLTGELLVDRVVAIGGPAAANPRLVRTRLGASLAELTAGEGKAGEEQSVRVISGSVLSGRTSSEPVNYLGRRHTQISLLVEGNHRDLLGWMGPGFDRYSIKPIFASSWLSSAARRWKFTTSTEGSHRAIVPMGMYERVMPLDIIPTPLLKALCVQDNDTAQMLGCLELDEEDLGLCTFVCPGKNDYGPMLRQSLTTIEHEG